MKACGLSVLLVFLAVLHKSHEGDLLEVQNVNGETVLHMAAKKNLRLTKMLIAAGADVNAADGYGTTPLHYAVISNQYEIVQVLIDNKANINCLTVRNETALFWNTLSVIDSNITSLLISAGIDINFPNRDGITPIHNAIIKNNRQVFDVLLENKADANIPSSSGVAPLHSAASKNVHYVSALLDHGADISLRDRNNATSLHIATANRKPEIVKELILRGADIKAQDNNKNTALHEAMDYGYFDIVEVILTVLPLKLNVEVV